MTDSELIVFILKTISTFFVLGCAYALLEIERNDDDDDDDEGTYQPVYNNI